MLPSLSLTLATAADVPELLTLVNGAYRGETSRQGWTTEADLLDGARIDAAALHEMLRTSGAAILTGRNEHHELIGCTYVHAQPPRLYLGMLSVAPARQALGTGKYLLRAAEDYARRHHCQHLRITVLTGRPELLAWYERHGYQRTGATEPFPTDTRFGIPKQPLTLLVLEKPVH